MVAVTTPPGGQGYATSYRGSFPFREEASGVDLGTFSQQNPLLTPPGNPITLEKWQDSLRVESVITKSTHFVALPEYPRNSPHRAAWVSSLSRLFWIIWLDAPLQTL